MSLSKNDVKAIENIVEETGRRILSEGQRKSKDLGKRTEKRLYAYPTLKANIERYKLDIEDVKKEDMKRSKDFVVFLRNSGGDERPDLEELREAKILVIEQKINRDRAELKEMTAALETVKKDEYYKLIPLIYFEKRHRDEVEREMNCDKTTVWRNKKRLLNVLNVSLYGADAL